MRRSDREITDRTAICEIIRACDCCRLGFRDGAGVYILPLNFAFVQENGADVFYFHCANEGKKLDLIRTQPHIGFELDTDHALHAADSPCGFSYRFQSVIGQGDVSLVEDPAQKLCALRQIVARYSGRDDWDFPAGAEKSVTVIKLVVTELACKVHE